MTPRVIVAPHFRQMAEVFRPSSLERLRTFAEVVWGVDGPMPRDLFERELASATAVVFGSWSYGDALERSGNQLRAVLEVAGAHDHHEMGYERCFERGIAVGGAAPAFGRAVAEMGVGLTLASTRGIAVNDRAFRTGEEQWFHDGNVGFDTLFGRTAGFVGCGGLSIQLQRLLDPLGLQFLGYDPFIDDATLLERGIRPRSSLEAIIDASDVVYVLAAPTAENRALIDRPLLERLQPHQTLVLLSRASLVDFDAVTELVLSGRFRLATDVFPSEPIAADHPIRHADNAVLSAHRAGAVPAALLAIGDLVVGDLEAMITGLGEQRMQYLTPDRAAALIQPTPRERR